MLGTMSFWVQGVLLALESLKLLFSQTLPLRCGQSHSFGGHFGSLAREPRWPASPSLDGAFQRHTQSFAES